MEGADAARRPLLNLSNLGDAERSSVQNPAPSTAFGGPPPPYGLRPTGAEPNANEDPGVRPVDLHTRDWRDSIACSEPRPALSWRLEADRAGVRQLGYEIEVAATAGFEAPLVTSGFVETSRVMAAPWPGDTLASRQVRWARVRVWTDGGRSAWSTPLRVEGALFETADWLARPISPLSNVGLKEPGPAALLRRSFRLDHGVASARLYLTSLGVNTVWINGSPVSDALLDPGWTVYPERLLYAAYDVAPLLRQGENVIAAAVADGWWRGDLTWFLKRCVYGDTTALLAQLEIVQADGEAMTIATDETWRGATGSILSADLYQGSTIDLRRKPQGWREPGFDDSGWQAVAALDLPANLEMRSAPPVRVIQTRTVEGIPTAWNTLLIDTGQNLSGVLRLHARGKAGDRIEARHAEVLDDRGRPYTAMLRGAKSTDVYYLADDQPTVLEPVFTFHGFRHAEIEASPGVEIEAVELLVIASDLEETGQFACSNRDLNKLFENVFWSQRSNFLALPTDCPQRDERMGWAGDIQVFAPTACMNADARAFLESWLKDLALEQRADGCVPATAPNVIQGHEFEYGGVGWGDAATLTPWALYEAFGDPQVLASQFESMRRWVDYGASRRGSDGTWRGDFQLGDWLDPGAPSDAPEKATTDSDYIATAYLSRSAAVVAKAARVLGDETTAGAYDALSRETAKAAWDAWGERALTTQTGAAMAIAFDIVPAAERDHAVAALADLVERTDGRIATGFLGTPLVLPALADHGRTDAAYALLLNRQCPGWLYQLDHGATTMWERWDAIRPDGSVHRGDMASGGNTMMSFNHYAYGAVAAFLYRSVAGIGPCEDDPGYGTILFAPKPGGGLTEANGSVITPYGRAAIGWRLRDGAIEVELDIPPGARGRLIPPSGGVRELESGHHWVTVRP
ncbi:MAG: putative hydrolase [Caulobacteraceae bacterium]|nr:putative hydrolase [Caulobacteraceae bacterium]